MNQRLERFLFQHNLRARAFRFNGMLLAQEQAHTCRMLRPNLYIEHDIGNKNVRYPDGRLRSVRTRKIKDTAGTTFYAFNDSTPLS